MGAWRSLLGPAVATILAFTLLVGLGAWQLQRLGWKEGVLARIDARIHATPAPPPAEAAWAAFDADAMEYRHVSVSGTFEHEHEALVFRASSDGTAGADGPGYLVLTPLRLADGAHILINRGFVPLAKRDAAARAAGQVAGVVSLTGLLRSTEPRNPFTPPDDPGKGEWFTRDVAEISAHFALARAAPFSIDADAAPNPGGFPRGGATVLAIPNNHFSYALTWFGLAIGLLGVFVAFAWGRIRQAA